MNKLYETIMREINHFALYEKKLTNKEVVEYDEDNKDVYVVKFPEGYDETFDNKQEAIDYAKEWVNSRSDKDWQYIRSVHNNPDMLVDVTDANGKIIKTFYAPRPYYSGDYDTDSKKYAYFHKTNGNAPYRKNDSYDYYDQKLKGLDYHHTRR